MIVVVNMCAHTLHEREFVEPIAREIPDAHVVHYQEISDDILSEASAVVLCGTSLLDDEFLHGDFHWIKSFTKPILGICAGMQIIAQEFGAPPYEHMQIGQFAAQSDHHLFREVHEVYMLHHMSAPTPPGFEEVMMVENIPAAIQKGNILGIMFHPEVNNISVIQKWLSTL